MGGVDAEEGGGKVIRFTLPSLPTSHNRLHRINHIQRRVSLSDEARRWRSQMMLLVPRFEIPESSLLRVDYVAYYKTQTANGKRRRIDCSNFMKLLLDTICARIGVDDSRVSEGSFASVDAVEERVEVTLTEILSDEWRERQQ
jgi:Holliday junction resolvase RusA-like endonuclease